MRLRNGEITLDDWKVLMKQTPAAVGNASTFQEALHLFPTAAAVWLSTMLKNCEQILSQ